MSDIVEVPTTDMIELVVTDTHVDTSEETSPEVTTLEKEESSEKILQKNLQIPSEETNEEEKAVIEEPSE